MAVIELYLCFRLMSLLKLLHQNMDLLRHRCDVNVWLFVPLLVLVFAVVALFVCTQGAAVEHLMRTCAVFVYVCVCSYGDITTPLSTRMARVLQRFLCSRKHEGKKEKTVPF